MLIIWVKEQLFKINFYEKNRNIIDLNLGNNLHN